MAKREIRLTQEQANKMASHVTLFLDIPPTANTYYRMVNNRMLLSSKARVYRKAVDADIKQHGRKRFPMQGRLAVSVAIYPANKRSFDLDNRLKPLLDALEHAGVFENDGAIDDLRIVRCALDPAKEGYCVVQLEQIL